MPISFFPIMSFSDKLFLFQYLFFKVFSLALSIETNPSVLILLNFHYLYGKQLPTVVLKGCPYVEVSLYSLQMSSGFGGRAGYDVNTSQVFLRVYWQLSPW